MDHLGLGGVVHLTCSLSLSLYVGRYDLITSCWDTDPSKRPSFSDLVSKFDNLLSAAHVSSVIKHMIRTCVPMVLT